MSELNLVSPLLDGMTPVEQFSDRGRSKCWYLERSETDEKFVVKHISIPESETKTQALILTGAVADEAAANEYYRGLVEDLRIELDALRALPDSGVLGYQIVPREHTGFDVYVLMPRKTPLCSYLKDNAITQLQALNLGLDMCDALGEMHSSGYAYLDLKPENVFIDSRKRFTIGDLGLMKLDDMEYFAVPEEYVNEFSAPELSRLIPEPTESSDQYSLGLLLFYVFNGNRMPFEDGKIPAERAREKRLESSILPSPQYADYELAEIISRACSLDPANRYASFAQLKQDLTLYMQRNEVSDQLIVPPLPEPEPEQTPEAEEAAEQAPAAEAEEAADTGSVPEEMPEPESWEAAGETAEPETGEAAGETAESETGEAADEAPEPETAETAGETPEPEAGEAAGETPEPETGEAAGETPEPETGEAAGETPEAEDTAEQASSAEEAAQASDDEDSAHPEEPEAPPDEEALPPDLEAELAEAGESAGEPAETIEELLASVSNVLSEDERSPVAEAPDLEANEAAVKEPEAKKKKKKVWIPIVVVLLVLSLITAALVYFYTQWYTVRMDAPEVVDATADSITVAYELSTPDPDLSWECIDTYGNSYSGTAGENRVQFQDLKPDTQYTINFFPGKLHKLTGTTSVSAYTAPATQIESMTAVQAAVRTTAEIALTVSGKEPSEWLLTYSSAGSDSGSVSFSGHSVEITGLRLNDTYTFELTSPEDVYLTGQTACELKVIPDVQAANLQVSDATFDSLTVSWDSTGDQPLSWTVRCQGEGYDETKQVTECYATFTGVRMDADYTFQVSAEGLEAPLSFSLPKNARIVSSFRAEATDGGSIHVSWVSSDPQPEGGWVLHYQIGGQSDLSNSQNEEKEQDTYIRGMPGNAEIVVSIEPMDGQSVIGKTTLTVLTAEAAPFAAHEFNAEDSEMALYEKPETEDLKFDDLGDSASAYDPGDEAVVVVTAGEEGYRSEDTDETIITFAVRSQTGSIVQFRRTSSTWNDIFNEGRYMTQFKLPEAAGKYQIALYFDGRLVSESIFSINETEQSEQTEEDAGDEG